jgi:hypothetical protein
MNRDFQHQRLVLAYHGCEEAIANEVLLSGTALRQSQKDYDWLGSGIYFWEHGPERALEWAKAKKDIKKPAVLGAVIHLGQCFDLLDRGATQVLADAFPDFKNQMESQGRELPLNKQLSPSDEDWLLRRLDCSVFNWLLDFLDADSASPSFDSVRGLFQEDAPVFPDSGIKLKSHIQIAIRNPSCILGYFKPS